ncbi:TrkA family potassium uptake protein [Georgenia sp. EYE_87]|uniref:potassium channel family protein n=1 Tax=Georgenia sp. EYE_87 TaxID=2853448 RepID=UPI00200373D3|nr:TrkA family potassium uptake protein [Georgenia sp. EYE_87]MCK6210453.1 TrkA family potassium uptake protein [Georgenia sp. EYE_87]
MASSTHRHRVALDSDDSVVVVGLGRFGRALAIELASAGVDVLGIDTDEDIVQSLGGVLTNVVRADATKEEVLRQLSVPDFSHAVVAIGSSVEASILVSSWLLRFEVENVWAKAINDPHGQILTQLGVQHVVYPEADMGRRTAHLLRGSLADYQDIGGGFAMVTAPAPPSMVGRPLDKVGFRKKHNLNVVAVRQPDGTWGHATGETILNWNDTVVVIGPSAVAERFIDMA